MARTPDIARREVPEVRAGCAWILSIGLGLFFLLGALVAIPLLIPALIFLALGSYSRSAKAKHRKFIDEYDNLLRSVPDKRDEALVEKIRRVHIDRRFNCAAWSQRHQTVYREVFEQCLEGGISSEESQWLRELSSLLVVNDAEMIQIESIRPILWEIIADHEVTPEEREHAEQLLAACSLSPSHFVDEFQAFSELQRFQKFKGDGLPAIRVDINLQKSEICHHKTTGSFLEKRVLRSRTIHGHREKEEGLVTTKEGDLYVTSKRILMAANGASSIPHGKVLEVEIDHDQKLIIVTKDGRETPLYIRVPDVVYTGALLEYLSSKCD